MGNDLIVRSSARHHRDMHGDWRQDAFYQGITSSAAMSRSMTTYYGNRRWIDDPSYALESDADILEKVQRDPVICKAMDLRRHMVCGTNLYWDAPDVESQAVIPYFDGLLKNITNFRQSLLALTEGVFTGISFLRMLTNGAIGKFHISPDTVSRPWWVPHLVHLHRGDVRAEFDNERKSDPDAGTVDMPEFYWTTRDPFTNRWGRVKDEKHYVKFIYHNDAATLGYGRGVLDAIYFYSRCKVELLKFMLQGIERFAVPWVMIGIDPDAHAGTTQGTGLSSPEDLAAQYLEVTAKMRAGNAMVLDKRHSITTLDFSGEAAKGLLNLIEYFDERLVQMILAASMPTGGGEKGSFARAAVEAGSTSTYIRYDRILLEESLRALTWQLWERNRKNWVEILAPSGVSLINLKAPELRIGREQMDDPSANMQLISQALASGIPLRKSDVYRLLNLSKPDSGDDVFGPPGSAMGPGGVGPVNPLTGEPTMPPVVGMNDGVAMSETQRRNAQKFADVVRSQIMADRKLWLPNRSGANAPRITVRDYVMAHRGAVEAA